MATTSYGTPYVEAADLVSGYPSTSLSLADRVDDISFKGNGINNQTGTTYTLDILDAGKTVTLSNSSAVTVTIPTNTAEAIEIGSVIRFNNKGAGTVTIQPDGGVTLNGGNITLAQNAGAQIVKLDTNTWGSAESFGSPAGLTLITTATLSGSSVSINNCFSSTYQNYRVVVNPDTSADVQLRVRMRVGGTDATGASDYTRQIFSSANTSNLGGRATNSYWHVSDCNGVASKNSFSFEIYKPFQAEITTYNLLGIYGDVNSVLVLSTGMHLLSTSYDGFTLFPASGTISGTLRVYGYRNS